MHHTASLKRKWIDSTNTQLAVRFRRLLCRELMLLSVIILGTFQFAAAQSYLTQIGVPPFTTALPVENGFLNVANGNLHLSIPLGSFPERGSHPFVAGFVYDSRIWQVVSGTSSSWQPTNAGSQGGWRFITSADTGGSVGLQTYGDRYGAGVIGANWTDALGVVHVFPVSVALSSNGNCVNSSAVLLLPTPRVIT